MWVERPWGDQKDLTEEVTERGLESQAKEGSGKDDQNFIAKKIDLPRYRMFRKW